MTAGADKVVKIWEITGTKADEKHSFRGHKDWVSSVAFSSDGAFVISASVDRTVKLWELVSREAIPGSGHTQAVKAVAVSPDGKLLASGSTDNTVRVWDVANGRELHVLIGHEDKVMALAFAPDSKTLVSAASGANDRSIRIWDATTGKEVKQIKDPGPQNNVPVLTVSADGKKIILWVADEGNCLIEVYDLATGKQESSKSAFEGKITSLAFSADAELAALGSDDGRLQVVKLPSLEKVFEMPHPVHAEGIADLTFTADKKKVITTDSKGAIKIWDVATLAKAKPGMGKEDQTINGHKTSVAVCVASPKGKYFATAGFDSVVKLWDMTGKEVHKLGFRKAVRAEP